jgi:hypothetical protein
MEHPFIGNLSDKSMDELTEVISKLNKNLAFASRSGRYEMASQIQMALESYRSELNRQQQKLLDEDGSFITGKIDIT